MTPKDGFSDELFFALSGTGASSLQRNISWGYQPSFNQPAAASVPRILNRCCNEVRSAPLFMPSVHSRPQKQVTLYGMDYRCSKNSAGTPGLRLWSVWWPNCGWKIIIYQMAAWINEKLNELMHRLAHGKKLRSLDCCVESVWESRGLVGRVETFSPDE